MLKKIRFFNLIKTFKVVINVHFRGPMTHNMSSFVRVWFLERLPRLMFMQRPLDYCGVLEDHEDVMGAQLGRRRQRPDTMKPSRKHRKTAKPPPVLTARKSMMVVSGRLIGSALLDARTLRIQALVRITIVNLTSR
jgi:hypothetical protein